MSLEGQQIGRYRIVRFLGSGGMGEVYLAEDARIEQQVAIKVIRAEVSPYPNKEANQEAARLFQREAKAIAKLDHPHILPLYDYGEQPLGNLTVIYLVMPYRREGSLSDWLRHRNQAGLLSPQEVAHVISQAASALQHAHDQQVIHQDVKPANFLIRHRPEQPTRPDLLLADFGIAKLTSATASASQSVRGTPTYMAPEQWDGQPVPATDQYALAVMIYELLTGRPPFQGGPGQVMRQHFFSQPQPPSALDGRLPPSIDTVLLRALSKQATDRFKSVAAFAQAFRQAIPSTEQPMSGVAEIHKDENELLTRTRVTPMGEDIKATLAISPSEAQMGTTRTLTLPGGRKVTVPVPAGIRDGQILRLDGQGEASTMGGATGALILSIMIKTTEEPSPFAASGTAVAEATVLTAQPAATKPTPLPPTLAVGATPPPATKPTPLPATQPVVATPLPAILSTYQGHSDAVYAVAWSPDGKRLASAGNDRTAQIWDSSTGKRITTYRGYSSRIYALAWSPDGSRIAFSPGNFVQVWDAARDRLIITYRGYSDYIYALAWSPDGSRIAFSPGNFVQVWDAAKDKLIVTYTGHSSRIRTLGWSPDGKQLASAGDDRTVQIWDSSTGKHIITYTGHSDWIRTLGWSPDGKQLASAGDDRTVQIWNSSTGKRIVTYRGYSDYIYALTWSPDGSRIAFSPRDFVQIWDTARDKLMITYRGYSDYIYALTWSPDGSRIAFSPGNAVQVWQAT